RYLHAFPSRRSSDLLPFDLIVYLESAGDLRDDLALAKHAKLGAGASFGGQRHSKGADPGLNHGRGEAAIDFNLERDRDGAADKGDRKSTRLNSSHVK